MKAGHVGIFKICTHTHTHTHILKGVRGVTVTAIGNGHDNPSSNPGWENLQFT